MSDTPLPVADNTPVESYSLSLLFDDYPDLDFDAVRQRLQARCGPVDLVEPLAEFQSHQVCWPQDADTPTSRAVIYRPSKPDRQQLGKALRQTWDWPAAEGILGRCRASVLVGDYLAQRLPYRTRLHRLQQLVAAIAETTPCVA